MSTNLGLRFESCQQEMPSFADFFESSEEWMDIISEQDGLIMRLENGSLVRLTFLDTENLPVFCKEMHAACGNRFNPFHDFSKRPYVYVGGSQNVLIQPFDGTANESQPTHRGSEPAKHADSTRDNVGQLLLTDEPPSFTAENMAGRRGEIFKRVLSGERVQIDLGDGKVAQVRMFNSDLSSDEGGQDDELDTFPEADFGNSEFIESLFSKDRLVILAKRNPNSRKSKLQKTFVMEIL